MRYFNERAVPGLGGVWFGKQIALSLLGVHLAQVCERGKLEVANAIEALACWMAIHELRAGQDPRLRGRVKLAGVTRADLVYREVKRAGFYVSQPMRMATVQTLPALGLVEAGGTRFNAYACTRAGHDLIEAWSQAYRPSNSTLEALLAGWIRGDETMRVTDTLCRALAPTEPLPPDALGQLHECLQRGGHAESPEDTARRRDLLAWADARRAGTVGDLDWHNRPSEITSNAHWHDLEAGARFFQVRDAALDLLATLEALMPASGVLLIDSRLCDQAGPSIAALRRAASAYLRLGHAETLSTAFSRECLVPRDEDVIRTLVVRDGLVLLIRGNGIVQGHGFVSRTTPVPTAPPVEDTETGSDGPVWPASISHRVPNLYRLNLDLHGELATSIAGVVAEEGME